ncbi:MAG: putative ABC transporter permease, partial [Butyricicoccus sp.]|nr:putative ABC transporter permease [Butyricicoccus sp.]
FIFYVYCVFGWIFESTVVSLQERRFVNRGFLDGPMLPIYGFGAVIMLHVSLPLMGRPVALFLAGMVVATAFEYAVGVLMETLFKVKYWDYSSHKFQFQGRICLRSSLAWGGLSLILPYWLHRPVAWLIETLPQFALWSITGVVSVWFIWDVIDSTRTALDLARVLSEVERVRAETAVLREQLTEQLAEARAHAAEEVEETRARLYDLYTETRWKIEASSDRVREEYTERMEQLYAVLPEGAQEYWQKLEEHRLQLHLALMEAEDGLSVRIGRMRARSRRALRGNPTLRSVKFRDAAEELRRLLREKK